MSKKFKLHEIILKGIDAVKDLVRENIKESKEDWDAFETSWDFKRHPLI